MTATPLLTGQDIGMAHYATRAVLEQLLARHDLSFVDSLCMNVLAGADTAVARDSVVQRVTYGLKIDAAPVVESLDQLVARGLVAQVADDAARVELTASGRDVHQMVRTGISQIVDRLYGGLASDDLATAQRVLGIVTERANAELASQAG